MNRTESKRYEAVREAVKDEQIRFNKAIDSGKVVLLRTFSGEYVVDYVDTEFWFHTHSKGQSRGYLNTQSWAGCNDGTWAELMFKAGLDRNKLFANHQIYSY